ncbi:NUDIX hydrolase [Sunxiuqinia sp. A32]|uniref:NUDIX hydrolase n=1 Tax=Sunxiuqinia sp. A32 TaxID=3461496 RepID=UPI0040467196
MIIKNLSIDCVIFGFDGNNIKVLLTQHNAAFLKEQLESMPDYDELKDLYRDHPALVDKNSWSIFGAHLPAEMDLDQFASDFLNEITGMSDVFLKQFHCFGQKTRVPHYRVVTVAYYALINPANHQLKKSIITNELKWFTLDNLPKLNFDHRDIVQNALENLRKEVRYHPIGFHLLPEKFTLTQIQTLYEVILDKKMDTRNFRKKINNMGLLIDTGQKQQNVSHRAAKLYKFDINVYERLKNEGLKFRIE